jgi:hypothetical protein
MKPTPVRLLCSDLHGRPRIDEQFAFSQIVDAALDLDVSIIAAGDLLDKQSNRAATITFFYQQLNRLREADLLFEYVQGQHDFDDPPWLSGHDSAVHLHRRTVEPPKSGIRVYGLDWQPTGRLQEELDQIPEDVNFLVAHQVWADWMGSVASPQGSFAELPGHIKYLHSGDLHQWKLDREYNRDRGFTTVLSTGAVTQQKIDEPAIHYYAVLYLDGSIVQRKLRSRQRIDCGLLRTDDDLENCLRNLADDVDQAVAQSVKHNLPVEMHRPYLRVVYSYRLPFARRRIEKLVGDRVVGFYKQLPPELADSGSSVVRVDRDVPSTPQALLIEEISPDESKLHADAYTLCERLLGSQNPADTLATWKREYLGDSVAAEEDDVD